MDNTAKLLNWWDPATGVHTVAELRPDGRWKVAEMPEGGTNWTPVPVTPEILLKIEELLKKNTGG